jgi:hypothetical protein
MHPENESSAIGIAPCRQQGRANRLRGGQNGLGHDRKGQCRIERSRDGLAVGGDLGESFRPVKMLAAGEEPETGRGCFHSGIIGGVSGQLLEPHFFWPRPEWPGDLS